MPEYSSFLDMKNLLDLSSFGGNDSNIATQFSIGQNYWSHAHVDQDAFFTFLSCLSNEASCEPFHMYFFCFPEYKVAIPIRSGDILVFNPLKIHCCTNCRYPDLYIFSAYVSMKSVMTAGIGKFHL